LNTQDLDIVLVVLQEFFFEERGMRGFFAQAGSEEVQTVHSKRYQRNVYEEPNPFEQLRPTTFILDSADPTPVAPIDIEPPSKEYLKA
jgi:hypothetical protein